MRNIAFGSRTLKSNDVIFRGAYMGMRIVIGSAVCLFIGLYCQSCLALPGDSRPHFWASYVNKDRPGERVEFLPDGKLPF